MCPDGSSSFSFRSGPSLLRRVLLALALASTPVAAQDRVSQTVHNLSVTGPGGVRAEAESQVCIFCHAPHNTQGVRPLWNRELSAASYRIYQSSTLNARPGQPTGSSKLCLSCHDGTVALGSVLSRSDQIRMRGGEFLPAGLANLGTDLSDDHPVSFHYTDGLAAEDQQLRPTAALPSEVRLDAEGRLQCTSCHDPHHNAYGSFLVRPENFGTLCASCHDMNGWTAGSHHSSGATVVGGSTDDWPFSSVAENACRSCHRAHTAGGHERLLIHDNEEDNCLNCHDGSTARRNIRAELDKRTAHDPRRYLGLHDPVETPGGRGTHVECADCHNPHAAAAQPPTPGYIFLGATMQQVTGVNMAGTFIAVAQNEYEICFKCHADYAVPTVNPVPRVSQTANLRLKFSPGNASFHPVAMSSPSSDTVSLIPELPRGSLIRCTDCHAGEDGPGVGGTGPAGPHGSSFDFLLERNYEVTDDATESEDTYSLCYKCHRRSSILGDESFPEHRRHIVEERTPCSACHDPHGVTSLTGGSTDRTHLINFDTTIVRPESETNRIEFRDRGRFAGSCTLTCHGTSHRDEVYGP